MLTKRNAKGLYTALCRAPAGWYESPEGRRIIAKVLRQVRRLDGREEARILRDLLTVARTA